MSVREMVNCVINETPNMIAAIKGNKSGTPQMLEELSNLTENITDNARGTGVAFRITLPSIRASLSTIKDNATASWHLNADKIVETVESLSQQLQKLSKHLSN